jgi:endonuclease-8
VPEGDTIHRTARRLSRAFKGKTVSRFVTTVPEHARVSLAGVQVRAVEARGKYLAIVFGDGHVLITHMRMTGSWHLYRAGERWWQPEHLARVVLEVLAGGGDEALVGVCFAAPVVRLVREAEADRDLATLGPDIVAPAFDEHLAVARLRAEGPREIGDALLDQGALAGIGNVYKSEVLFAEAVSPFARVQELGDPTLYGIVVRARRLMQRNLDPSMSARTTVGPGGGSRYAVYRRRGRPCPRCSAPIARAVQGRLRRSTYYCPQCQRAP